MLNPVADELAYCLEYPVLGRKNCCNYAVAWLWARVGAPASQLGSEAQTLSVNLGGRMVSWCWISMSGCDESAARFSQGPK